MSMAELQDKVAFLERELNDLKLRLLLEHEQPGPNDWQKTIGMFKDDPLFDSIVRRGREYRESQPCPEDVEL